MSNVPTCRRKIHDGMISTMIRNVQRLDESLRSGTLLRSVLERHEADIMEQQQRQLLEGRSATGEDLRPYYTEDVRPSGWFTTRQKAENYARWKQSLSYPYTASRNPDAPNLYVTGAFYSDLRVVYTSEGVGVEGDTVSARRIIAKYGKDAFGLCPDRWGIIFDERGAKRETIEKAKELLWQG